jgi:hypothetical protein
MICFGPSELEEPARFARFLRVSVSCALPVRAKYCTTSNNQTPIIRLPTGRFVPLLFSAAWEEEDDESEDDSKSLRSPSLTLCAFVREKELYTTSMPHHLSLLLNDEDEND